VVMDPSTRWWLEDGSAAVENMLIAATALGYGSCWLEGYTLPLEEELKALLNVPKEKKVCSRWFPSVCLWNGPRRSRNPCERSFTGRHIRALGPLGRQRARDGLTVVSAVMDFDPIWLLFDMRDCGRDLYLHGEVR